MDIKIRAWDERNKKFWYSGQEGDVTDDNYQFQTMFNPDTGKLQAFLIGPPFLVATDPMEACDYEHIELPIDINLGVKDLYTNDIVDNSKGESVICYDRNQAIFKTVPVNLYLANAGNGGWTGFDIRYAGKLIGNVHQNPELLQQP